MGPQIRYRDAVRILGGADSSVFDMVDRLLGVVIISALVATGRLEMLAFLEGRDELIKQAKKLLSGIGKRVRGARGKSRIELLLAAHSIIAINAYFEALSKANLPVDLAKLGITERDKLLLADASPTQKSRTLVDKILEVPLPVPAAHRPYEKVVAEMRIKYKTMSANLLSYTQGLAIWDKLSVREREELEKLLINEVPSQCVNHYKDDFLRLATECTEFRMWIYLSETEATRAVIRTGLSGLREKLDHLASERSSATWPKRLVQVYRSELQKPIVDASPDEVYGGLSIPLLDDGYIDPSFQTVEYGDRARPADEDWWSRIPTRTDMSSFIAGHLTSSTAYEVPMVALGHPGSGKSLFTKMLAANLVPQEYLPVRVQLRRVASEMKIKDQIEAALSDVTNEDMEWSKLAHEAGDALIVVLIDGFDEMLQATKVSHSNYLEEIQEFQNRESAQGRRVAVIVTSRTIVADRVRYPEGTVLVRLEPFSDFQISQWLRIWNEINSTYFGTQGLRPLLKESVLLYRDLAKQPLLLLMLALYDADANALQHNLEKLEPSELYEKLITKFVDREVRKLYPRLEQPERTSKVAGELEQLSILALGIFNRGRKSLSAQDLNEDMQSFHPQDNASQVAVGEFDHRFTPGELMVGRFFFVHRSQALVDGSSLREYEFLHATFGEYLVARILFLTLNHMIEHKVSTFDPSLRKNPSSSAATRGLWSLLSFALLTDGSQTISFLQERFSALDDDRRTRFQEILDAFFADSLQPRLEGYAGYQPRKLDVPKRHAIFSANLLVLRALLGNIGLRASDLFSPEDSAVQIWRSFALLWLSQFEDASWQGFVNTFSITHTVANGKADLKIRIVTVSEQKHADAVPWPTPEQADQCKDNVFMLRQTQFLCMPEMDLLVHALDPLLRRHPDALGYVIHTPGGRTVSLMHEALRDSSRHVSDKLDGLRMQEEEKNK